MFPKYDFANTLYAFFPQMYVVVTCNCATNLSSLYASFAAETKSV